MKGLCHKCHSSGIEVILAEIIRNDIGISEIPLCDKCRNLVRITDFGLFSILL